MSNIWKSPSSYRSNWENWGLKSKSWKLARSKRSTTNFTKSKWVIAFSICYLKSQLMPTVFLVALLATIRRWQIFYTQKGVTFKANMSYAFHIYKFNILFILIFSPNLDQLVHEWPFLRSFNTIKTSALHFKTIFLLSSFLFYSYLSRDPR